MATSGYHLHEHHAGITQGKRRSHRATEDPVSTILSQSPHRCDKEDTESQTGEHKQAVRRGDPKNGIAVHAHESNHVIDWDDAQVRSVSGYWQRRATEAIQIKKKRGNHELGWWPRAANNVESHS